MWQDLNLEKEISTTSNFGTPEYSCKKKKKLYPYHIQYAEVKPKWIKDVNIRIKFLKENVRVNLHHFEYYNRCFAMTPRAQATREKR